VTELGAFVVPDADALEGVLAQVQAAEEGGLELIGIQDHPYQRRFLDTFALLAFLAARTTRVRLFPDVANLPLRHPAMLAKSAASLDVLSRGRFELGLGAGAFWDAIAAMGGPRRAPGESIEALEEAIAILRACWSGERSVSFSGRHYSLDGLHPGPPPAHDIGIWLGAIGPRMMGVVGRLADGWVPSIPRIPLEDVAEKRAIMEEAARAAGRDPARIRRVANVNGVIAPAGSGRGDFLHGPAEQWVEELAGLATEHGFDGFVLWPEEDQLNQVDLYARYVAPGVREAVH
jgi:alkanesulfonate monooxygenase SsuD/methylene tetrahydromethanopterin reductase-like flavin-dependent oxidoreductase (luciferase family)